MKTFVYEAVDQKGNKVVDREVVANDRDDAMTKIKTLALYPTRVKEKDDGDGCDDVSTPTAASTSIAASTSVEVGSTTTVSTAVNDLARAIMLARQPLNSEAAVEEQYGRIRAMILELPRGTYRKETPSQILSIDGTSVEFDGTILKLTEKSLPRVIEAIVATVKRRADERDAAKSLADQLESALKSMKI